MISYERFIASKAYRARPSGFDVLPDALPRAMKPFQRAITEWSLRLGRAALFEGTGLATATPAPNDWTEIGKTRAALTEACAAVPFRLPAGIGSELYCAVEMGRKAIGAELKRSYFDQAVANLRQAELNADARDLFSEFAA